MAHATNHRVASWLTGKPPSTTNPNNLHPGDEFPLPTISNPSFTDSDDDDNLDEDCQHTSRANIRSLVHPPTPDMDDPPVNHSRRRSTSIASPIGGDGWTADAAQKHHRAKSEQLRKGTSEIPSDDEDEGDLSGDPESSDLELDDLEDEEGLEDDEETGLTRHDRRKRRQRRRRNTLLDQRVVPDGKLTKEEERLVQGSMRRNMLINALLIALWYLFSISISVYNKWMFKKDPTNDDGSGTNTSKNIFPFPLFTTCMHMIVQFSLAFCVLVLLPQFRPRHEADPTAPPPALRDMFTSKSPVMTKWFYFTRIGPCGAATSLDIGLGNTSLKVISLTFFTMCKSSVLGFVLLFAILFRLEKPSWRLGGIIATMTIGVVMMVAGETAFNVQGFILVMSSSMASGFRWSLTQILLLRNPATSNPFSSIFFLAPVMFSTLLILAVPVETIPAVLTGFWNLCEERGTILSILILLFPGVLAFLMTASEFALLKRTSVVTLSICGIFKEVVTISTASLVFEDKLTPVNISGLIITILSIGLYNYMKFMKMRQDEVMKAKLVTEQYQPVLSTEPPEDGRVTVIEDGNAGVPGRLSTSQLIRTSLSIQNPGPGRPRAEPDTPIRVSPVKRPEDLD